LICRKLVGIPMAQSMLAFDQPNNEFQVLMD